MFEIIKIPIIGSIEYYFSSYEERIRLISICNYEYKQLGIIKWCFTKGAIMLTIEAGFLNDMNDDRPIYYFSYEFMNL